MTCHIIDFVTYYVIKRKKLRKVKKGASYMFLQNKRYQKVYFYSILLSKLHVLTEHEKSNLLRKNTET